MNQLWDKNNIVLIRGIIVSLMRKDGTMIEVYHRSVISHRSLMILRYRSVMESKYHVNISLLSLEKSKNASYLGWTCLGIENHTQYRWSDHYNQFGII